MEGKGSQLLEKFAMNRCLKPTNFGNVVSRQVHSFSETILLVTDRLHIYDKRMTEVMFNVPF